MITIVNHNLLEEVNHYCLTSKHIDNMTTVGERISEARRSAGLTQPGMAARCGTTKQAISQIENGKTKSPRPDLLFKIADVLGYKARWLATGNGPRTRQEADNDTLDISRLSSDSKSAIRAVFHSFDQSQKSNKNTNNH